MSDDPTTRPAQPASASQTDGGASSAGAAPPAGPARSARPRRGQPIFARFIIAGAVVGVILMTLVAQLAEGHNEPSHVAYSLGRTLAYFAVIGGGLGALAGAVVALLLDRRR
ncbi:hypothetical protein [Arsenicicoccus sp. oral taxon 190]|uniref:hypothetical protein n=1 Tax=Arsenicicoccus sp. oral taxon 190 TaxID=1658671 RepID=UPI0012E1D2EB|nr:hypothetical protein [Arsenicicoccus sp. oral taxon 190]